MPRRPTSNDAVKHARFFLESFIERTDSQDHILPKNDEFSPFSGFCRVFPQFAKKKDGGSATDGVSRAAFNKVCLEYFEEGMRKPARNGNPGALGSNLAQQRRHFLRGRWLDPAESSDVAMLGELFSQLSEGQKREAEALLIDFSRWKPGPAGRGGERVARKHPADSEESEEDAEPQAKRRALAGQGGAPAPRRAVEGVASPPGQGLAQLPGVTPPRRQQPAPPTGGVELGAPGLLELLCMVASSVERGEEGASVGGGGSGEVLRSCPSSSASTRKSSVEALEGAEGRPMLPEPFFFPAAPVTGKRDRMLDTPSPPPSDGEEQELKRGAFPAPAPAAPPTAAAPPRAAPAPEGLPLCGGGAGGGRTSVASLCSAAAPEGGAGRVGVSVSCLASIARAAAPPATAAPGPRMAAVPAPFANLFRLAPAGEEGRRAVDEGVSRYSLGGAGVLS